jgi:membrane protein DedA with SNARE-associated domain
VETIYQFLMAYNHGPLPYLLVFSILLLCGFGLPVPEDMVLFAAALMAYYGAADVWIMIAVCFAGVMVGDSLVFLIGNYFGARLRRAPLVKKMLPPHRMKMVRRKLHEQGNKVIFAARFMPGLRTPVFFSAGTLHLPFRVFFFFDGLAALISVPTIVYTIYHFGAHLDRVITVIKRIQFGVIGTIVAIILLLLLKSWWAHRKEREIEGKL